MNKNVLLFFSHHCLSLILIWCCKGHRHIQRRFKERRNDKDYDGDGINRLFIQITSDVKKKERKRSLLWRKTDSEKRKSVPFGFQIQIQISNSSFRFSERICFVRLFGDNQTIEKLFHEFQRLHYFSGHSQRQQTFRENQWSLSCCWKS